MYSRFLQNYIDELAIVAEIQPEQISLLHETMGSFLSILARAINADFNQEEDLLAATLRLLLLDDVTAQMSLEQPVTENMHYLIGMGFEQTGELLTRLYPLAMQQNALRPPLQNDYWYRLILAMLHYLAGGHRIQALTILHRLNQLLNLVEDQIVREEYVTQVSSLRQLFRGESSDIGSRFQQVLVQELEAVNTQERRIQRLGRRIQHRRMTLLNELGQNNVGKWLASKQITNAAAQLFWQQYLTRLRERGVTSFTREQVGPGFDQWLRLDRNLLVVLPTGSGKSIIGELLTALTLASGKQVVWMLPTRSLVRQTRRDLRNAFPETTVSVEELPTTEDYIPLFIDSINDRNHIAVSTPEKLAALLRVNQDAARNVGLVVLDEAQLLLDGARGVTAESVLKDLYLFSHCKIALLTAFSEYQLALKVFLDHLVGIEVDSETLASSSRPTRRMYGVLTDVTLGSSCNPQILIYPPGIQSFPGSTSDPYKITLSKIRLSKSTRKPVALAQKLVEATNSVGIRSVFFVRTRVSTETQAKKLISRVSRKKAPFHLPTTGLARLQVELGRTSTVEETAPYGVAPHHAGLTSLEQHLVEQWTKAGLVRTVVATPTLAQGVNLPFDQSVVSFVTRRNPDTRANEPLSISEIQNMLGRAGRAGYVSDGICLIAAVSGKRDPVMTLDRQRRWFFSSQDLELDYVGIARLLRKATVAQVSRSDWPYELTGLDFSEVQALLSFVVRATENIDDYSETIQAKLKEFPSLAGESESALILIAELLAETAASVRRICVSEPLLEEAVARTGMPIEILQIFLERLRATPDFANLSSEQKLAWADDLVLTAIQSTSNRSWNQRFLGSEELDLESVMSGIILRRSGASIVEIETAWHQETRISQRSRINIGAFLNHRLSLFAQFWGAIAVCAELLSHGNAVNYVDDTILQMQTYVREGVLNLVQLEWLRRLGGLDRVLAHQLASISVVRHDDISAVRRYVREQIRIWRTHRNAIPHALGEPFRSALIGIIDDQG